MERDATAYVGEIDGGSPASETLAHCARSPSATPAGASSSSPTAARYGVSRRPSCGMASPVVENCDRWDVAHEDGTFRPLD